MLHNSTNIRINVHYITQLYAILYVISNITVKSAILYPFAYNLTNTKC
jgi:hypothetical protein